MPDNQLHKRCWRDYHTAHGARPMKDFISRLSEQDAIAVVAAMKEVEEYGLSAARHLQGEIEEVEGTNEGHARH